MLVDVYREAKKKRRKEGRKKQKSVEFCRVLSSRIEIFQNEEINEYFHFYSYLYIWLCVSSYVLIREFHSIE